MIGAVEVVRIVAGQTTSGTYTFTNVNMPGGTIVVNITPQLANPIPVSISAVGSTLTEGASATATASVGDGTQNVTYVWYLNGVSQTTGSTYTFGSNLGLGYYRLDVTAFTTDGTRAGSATASFQVVPMVNEGFEEYSAGSYPSAGGWYNLWSGISAAVVSGIAHSGNQSFYLQGQPNWVRADGINLPLGGVNVLTYSAAVMVPSGSASGRTGRILFVHQLEHEHRFQLRRLLSRRPDHSDRPGDAGHRDHLPAQHMVRGQGSARLHSRCHERMGEWPGNDLEPSSQRQTGFEYLFRGHGLVGKCIWHHERVLR